MIKILIANDERATVKLLERVIQRQPDMTCVGNASNGEEAIRKAQAFRPDVVLMDLMMPKIDGIEASKLIHSTVPNTRIIVTTARGDYTQRALNAGARQVLTLPLLEDDIVRTIREVANAEKKTGELSE